MPDFRNTALETPPPTGNSRPTVQRNLGFAGTIAKIRPLGGDKKCAPITLPLKMAWGRPLQREKEAFLISGPSFVFTDVFTSGLDHHTVLRFSLFSFPTH